MLLTIIGELPELPMVRVRVPLVPTRTPPKPRWPRASDMMRVGGDITIAATEPCTAELS